MKFHQLSIGESFTYQGEAYRKVSPLIAHSEKDGQQKMFRRADSVQIASAASDITKNHVDSPDADTSLKQLYGHCEKILERHIADEKIRLQALGQLQKEYSKLINSLD